MIYTSYFGNLRKLPGNVIPITICAKPPEWYTGAWYKKLAPTYHILMEWKALGDEEKYVKDFTAEVLKPLKQEDVCSELLRLSGGKDIALICFEKSGDFCHRHLVAEWLNSVGLNVRECAANN